MTPQATPTSDRARVRLRALLLAFAWALPGVLCAGHALHHALETDRVASHAAPSAEDWLVGIHRDRDHGHAHPDTAPIVSTDPLKKLDSAAPHDAVELDLARASLRLHRGAEVALASRSATDTSGPRAPPVS